jgi:hypothetical protein
VTIYLKDIDAHFAGMNAVWDQWLPKGAAPARATVEAKLCEPKSWWSCPSWPLAVKSKILSRRCWRLPSASAGFSSHDRQKSAAMRPARALIDLQALRHNYQMAREVTVPRPSP